MRVAIICETFLPAVNGVTTTLCHLLEHLQDNGHEALLFAPQGTPPAYAQTRVVPLQSTPLPFYPEVKVTPPQFGLTSQLSRFKPDLVHLVGPAVFGAVAPTVVKSLQLPLVSSYHTDFGSYSSYYGLGMLRQTVNAYLRWVHNRCLVTLCPSTATLRDLRNQGFRRLRLWPRGVDTRRFHPAHRSEAWRASVGVEPGEKLLLYVGRLAREKRIDLLPAALRGIEGAASNCRRWARARGAPASFLRPAGPLYRVSTRPGACHGLRQRRCLCFSVRHRNVWSGRTGSNGLGHSGRRGRARGYAGPG